jgi:hypothetical protein
MCGEGLTNVGPVPSLHWLMSMVMGIPRYPAACFLSNSVFAMFFSNTNDYTETYRTITIFIIALRFAVSRIP